MKTSLEEALFLASPRLSPRATPLLSVLIHGSVIALWFVLFGRAFFLHGVLAWSAGIVYVFYDTALLAFVTVKSFLMLRAVEAPETNGPRVTLGVIVATYNEASVLPDPLQALFDQTDGPDEIIIADDGSTDSTGVLLAERYGITPAPDGQI